jgi:integrase
MAGKVKPIKIDTREARARLEARGQPYYVEVLSGLSLGYRKGLRRSRWVTRRWVGDAYVVTTLDGVVDDTERADGKEILSFDQAKQKAFALASEAAKEAKAERGLASRRRAKAAPYLVRDAIEAYLAYLDRERKSGVKSRSLANTSILPKLGDVAVRDLTRDILAGWLHDLAMTPRQTRSGTFQPAPATDEERRRRRSSANRSWTILSAALRRAFDDGHVDSDSAWRRVRPLRDADAARVRRFTPDETRALIGAAEPSFRALLTAAFHTGARYQELGRLMVGDFEPAHDALLIRRSKSGKSRRVILTREASMWFAGVCAGRDAEAVMLAKPDGTAWRAGDQDRPMRRCCQLAGVAHGGIHVCRHTYASAAVEAGIPLHLVAQNLGQANISILQRHYAHISDAHRRETIQDKMTPLNLDDSNVVTLTRVTR